MPSTPRSAGLALVLLPKRPGATERKDPEEHATPSTVREGFRREDSENSGPLRTELDSHKAVEPRSPTISAHSTAFRALLSFKYQGFPDSSIGNEPACNVGDPGLIPGSERSAGEGIGYPLQYSWPSLAAQLVKNLPGMRETWVLSLGWEDPLEKGTATHSSILSWRIPRTE